jgi:energy-coupling factor transporter ATP-binding protein EcfA2
MSTFLINKITLKHFLGFPAEFEFDISKTINSAKNILIYGENGSGKTSLYQAITEFFNHHKNDTNQIDIYTNIFSKVEGKEPEVVFHIDKHIVEWNAEFSGITDPSLDSASRTAMIASYNYGHILDVYYEYRRKKAPEIDIGRLLVDQILYDYQPAGGSITFGKLFKEIEHQRDSVSQQKIQRFNNLLEASLQQLCEVVNKVLTVFEGNKENQLEITKFDIKTHLSISADGTVIYPVIVPTVKFFGKEVKEFHTLLNEARISGLMISLLFTKYLIAPDPEGEQPVKIMVLDDVLIGIDINNRYNVLKVLEEYFGDWQIIIMTYDRLWYDAILRQSELIWNTFEMHAGQQYGIPTPFVRPIDRDPTTDRENTKPDEQYVKYILRKANHHLENHDIHAAGLYARIAYETHLKNLCEKHQAKVVYKHNIGTSFNTVSNFYKALNNPNLLSPIKLQQLNKLSKNNDGQNEIAHNATMQLSADVENFIKDLCTFAEIPLPKGAHSVIPQTNNPPQTPSNPPKAQAQKNPTPPQNAGSSNPTSKGALPFIPQTNNPSQQPSTQTKLEQNINQPSAPKPSTSKNKSRYIPSHHAINQIETWLKMFATIDADKISIHTDITSLDQETQQIQRLEYGIAFYSYLIPVQIIDKVDESSILHNFTNKTMLTVFTNNVKNNITIKPTSLGILIHDDKLDLLSYPDDSDGSIHSTIVSLDINNPNSNSKKIIYNRLFNILL